MNKEEIYKITSKNCCLSASAGSGKTQVLVDRFCYLVEQGFSSPDSILAITFTEKAAGEMKKRIARELHQKGLEEKRRLIEKSWIGTIHGFCSRVLKENALEAGVDPYFLILEDYEARIMKEEVAGEVIKRELDNASTEVSDLVLDYGFDELANSVIACHEKMCSMGRSFSGFAPQKFSSSRTFRLKEMLEELLNLVPDGKNKETESWKKKKELIKPFIEHAGVLSSKDILEWNEIEEIRELLLPHLSASVAAYLKPTVLLARNEAEELINKSFEFNSLKITEVFYRLFKDFSIIYGQRKRQKSLLDFEDLQLFTRDLFIKNPSIRGHYRGIFDFILVDEFQDTNILQESLIDLIGRDDNLFVVGDRFQSIYRFRQADINVFKQFEEKVKSNSNGHYETMNDNYRGRKEILDFTGFLFKSIWQEDGDNYITMVEKGSFKKKDIPSVDILLTKLSEEGIEESRHTEARALALKVKKMVDEGYNCKDFAILLRSTTNIEIYEKAFRDEGIPFYTVLGRGFFHRQEIRDIINLLRVLDNSGDDMAVAAVLRSPVVDISSDGLFWLRRNQLKSDGRRLIDSVGKFKEAEELSHTDRKKLEEFLSWLLQWQEVLPNIRISTLIEKIRDDCYFDTRLIPLFNGIRKYANFRKLLEIVENFEEKGFYSLSEFIKLLENIQSADVQIGEAAVETEEGDAVKIMSIHQAKGLEFPVVIVADISKLMRKDVPSIFLTEDSRILSKIKNEISDEFEEPGSYNSYKENEKSEIVKEEKRIFYVACTRAKEHLILSGVLPDKKYEKPNSFYFWVNKYLGEFLKVGEKEIEQGVKISVSKIDELKEAEVPEAGFAWIDAVKEERPLEISSVEEKVLKEKWDPVISSVSKPLPAPARMDTFSVTDLLEFKRCPYRFNLSVRLNLPLEVWVEREEEEGLKIGTSLHQVMEGIDFKGDTLKSLERILREMELERDEETEIRRQVNNFLGSPLFDEVREAEILYRELPFSMKVNSVTINGKFDLLARLKGGRWVLLDYKTHDISKEEALEEAKNYAIQIELYGLAVYLREGKLPEKNILYFLASDTQAEIKLPSEKEIADNLHKIVSGINDGIGSDEPLVSEKCSQCPFHGKLCHV
ncbi:MAG: UvrD-helicase domain-containing protein [Firmicutes bacterium]|nr:UvrD-helicase domain-containing protein [Bacillota bacterium]